MSLSKLKFIQEKKTALCKQQRRQLADLLRQGKELSATIKVENIIRDDIYIELLEYLELYCELLLARISLITDRHECDKSLNEAVNAIVYAASHTELKELVQVKEWLLIKYGHEFGKNVLENHEGIVPEKIVSRCSVEPPKETLVDLYLCEIARTYSVPFSKLSQYPLEESEEKESEDDDDGEGGTKELEAPIAVDSKPKVKEQDEFDALKARFAALKTS